VWNAEAKKRPRPIRAGGCFGRRDVAVHCRVRRLRRCDPDYRRKNCSGNADKRLHLMHPSPAFAIRASPVWSHIRPVRNDPGPCTGSGNKNISDRELSFWLTSTSRSAYRSAPPTRISVKDRIDCVNAMLCNHAGDHRLLIDPRCKHLIKDFEQVCWKADPHGNALTDLDKAHPMRTHASDAAGYFLVHQFPMRAVRGERPGPAIF
jgi:hypothetical protein